MDTKWSNVHHQLSSAVPWHDHRITDWTRLEGSSGDHLVYKMIMKGGVFLPGVPEILLVGFLHWAGMAQMKLDSWWEQRPLSSSQHCACSHHPLYPLPHEVLPKSSLVGCC